MTEEKINEIEEALKLHSSYTGNYVQGSQYLDEVDRLSAGQPGIPLSKRVSDMFDTYFRIVGVTDLDEALTRLKGNEAKKLPIEELELEVAIARESMSHFNQRSPREEKYLDILEKELEKRESPTSAMDEVFRLVDTEVEAEATSPGTTNTGLKR